MKSRRPLLLLLAMAATACTTTTTTPSEPAPEGRAEDRISVTVADSGRSRGVQVTYLVEADLEATARAILRLEAHPEESMIVTAARVVNRQPTGGEIVIRFHGELGFPGDAIYRYRTDRSLADEFRYYFQVAPAAGGVNWQVMGSYTARADGKHTRVSYEFRSNHAALRRDQLMKMIRQDATAIMNRAEGG